MLKNLRDLGGQKTIDGKVVKTGMYIRSAGLFDLNEEDKSILLNKYKLKRVIDLRSEKEIALAPISRLEGVAYIHFPLAKATGVGLSEASGKSSLVDKLKNTRDDKERLSMIPNMGDLYREMLTKEFSRTNFRDLLLKLIAYEDGPTLFHCASGKDRTGMLVAAIYTILGVPREDIISEYMESIFSTKEDVALIKERVLEAGFNEAVSEIISKMATVDESYLLAFFDEMDKQFGGSEGFISEYLGLSEADVESFKIKCLE